MIRTFWPWEEQHIHEKPHLLGKHKARKLQGSDTLTPHYFAKPMDDINIQAEHQRKTEQQRRIFPRIELRCTVRRALNWQ